MPSMIFLMKLPQSLPSNKVLTTSREHFKILWVSMLPPCVYFVLVRIHLWLIYIFECEVAWNIGVMAKGSNVEQKQICSINWRIPKSWHGLHCCWNNASICVLPHVAEFSATFYNISPQHDYHIANGFVSLVKWHPNISGWCMKHTCVGN